MPPSVEIFGISIREPTTTITDYLITAVSWWFAAKLVATTGSRQRRPQTLYGISFLFVGLAALFGGTSHGFVLYMSDTARFFVWKGTIYAIGLSMLFAVAATVLGSALQDGTRRAFQWCNVAAFALYATWMLDHSEFVFVIYHYGLAMLAVASIQSWAFYRHRSASAPWLVAGVLITLLGAGIQQSGFSLHRQFNNNDLYHVVQIAGLYLLYRGAGLLRNSA